MYEIPHTSAEERDEDAKRQVVRDGQVRERRVTVGSGTVAVRAPRVNDKRVNEDSDLAVRTQAW